MADKTIGSLPGVAVLDDDTLIPVEQQGAAAKMTGEQFKNYARESASPFALQAQQSAVSAGIASGNAAVSAEKARQAREAIENMEVSADTLEAGSAATVRKNTSGGIVELTFGIPTGPAGPAGPPGDLSKVQADQFYASKPTAQTVKLGGAGWSNHTQSAAVSGVSADETAQLITITPALENQQAYMNAGVRCTGQSAGHLTFTCDTVPAADLTVYVVIQLLL